MGLYLVKPRSEMKVNEGMITF